ncbi:MAG TPA: zinc-binding dehydrogenase [Candidatus Tumulicola sp.]|jgi:NADPH:quinone reductase-like Zn-dependent oxidoreductase
MEATAANEMMRAARLHEIGGPWSLRVEGIPIPVPDTREVLVRLHAAALNRRDVFITQGLYPGIQLPRTLGADGAGTIAAAGPEAGALPVGTEVVIDPMLGWGLSGDAWDPETSNILGMPVDGTFAQYVRVPASAVYPKPARLTMQQAAAIPLAGLTAYRSTMVRGNVHRGQTVLVTGIGGGVATFALLFAKRAGARVIVTSKNDEKLERARQLGADVTYNYETQPDWHKECKKRETLEVVIDSSGGDTLAKALDALRPGGRIVVYGGTRGESTIKLFPLFWKHLSLLGTSMGSPQDFAAMLELFENEKLEPAVDSVYALDDVVGAAERMAASDQFGKVVLAID